MKLSLPFLKELQNRLKVGNRLSTHLNAIPKKSNYKLDFSILSAIDPNLPAEFLDTLFTKGKFSFEISWKDKEIDLFNLSTGEQKKFTIISKVFTNLLNHVKVIKEERGVETFGFGFPLIVRKDRKDKKLTVAPLIIWKLNLDRSKKNDAWIISKDIDSSIYLNEVLINHLQADSQIILDPLAPEILDDGIVSKEELFNICKDVLTRTNITKIANLDTILNDLFSEIKPIQTESEYEELPLNDTNCFLSYSGLFSFFDIQKHSIIQDYDSLIELNGTKISLEELEGGFFQSITSIETDPSQQGFLNALEKTRNIVIQGPPGTGKSQTLTALLINALENGKKTIVVCEKHTALEVLHKSLERVGLSSHSALIVDVSSDRQKIISAARDRVQNLSHLSMRFANGPYRFGAQLKNIKNVIERINLQHQTLDNKLLAQYKWSDIVGKYLKNHRLNNSVKISFPPNLKFSFTYDEYDEWRSKLHNGQRLFNNYVSTGENIILNPKKFLEFSFIQFDDNLNVSVSNYKSELDNISELKNAIFNQFVQDRNKELFLQKELIEESIKKLRSKKLNIASLISNHKDAFLSREKDKFTQEISRFSNAVNLLLEICNRNQNIKNFLNEENHKSILFKMGSWFSGEKKRILDDAKKFNETFDSLVTFNVNSQYFSEIQSANNLKEKVQNFLAFKRKYDIEISEFSRNAEIKFNSLDLSYLLDLSDSERILEHIELIQQRHFLSDNQKKVLEDLYVDIKNLFAEQKLRWLELVEIIKSSVDFSFDFKYDPSQVNNEIALVKIEKRIETVIESIQTKIDFEFLNADILKDKDLFSHLDSYSELKQCIESLICKINSDNYFLNFNPPVNLNAFIEYLESLINLKSEQYDQNPSALSNTYKWFEFFEKLSDTQKQVISFIKNENNWEYSFLIFYFDRLLLKNATNDVPHDDIALKEYLKNIENLKDNQIASINDYWFKKQKTSVNDFNRKSKDFQFKNLYNKKGSVGNRRYSLRFVIEKDCDLFTDLHPIILTTPNVASTLFSKKNGYFDFVVFDEASQLRLEDNLPALLKGKQIIIAGDEHQMPPSSFFEKKLIAGIIDNEEEEDDDYVVKDRSSVEAGLLSSISLLDAVSELNFKNYDLNFHYRSKHPYLIDFSNYAFYGQKLVPLPISSDYLPIKYINVGGVYESNVNEKEADVVISILKNNIHKDINGKYPSVGIATFNVKQRDLIKNKLLEIKSLDRDKDFIKKIEKLESKGMFIKNLENIQGDEKDVIIMSTTYGPQQNGKFEHRFGQLNNSKGYKLLNVIVTRAKYKNYVVTSIPEDHIGNFRHYLHIAGTNHGKAPIFAYLAYAKAVSEKNEDLRKSVLQALSNNNIVSDNSKSVREDKLESVFEEEVFNRLIQTELRDFIELQYKVGGFRIDMVVDFKIPGIPKIAIECDGAKYHSSDEAYLYDFHRQKILESHGFKFHRIWGTNWWRNPDYEMKKLLDFINTIKSPKSGNLFKQESTKENTFTDDVIIQDDESRIGFETDYSNELNIKDVFPKEEVFIAEEPYQKIEIGSIVKIKYLNENKILQFKIVSPLTLNKENKSDIKEVLFTSPLGKAVMNKNVGSISSIEGLDNIVEIIEIN